MSNSYVNNFLSLKCATDVIGSVFPICNANKEITESMGIISRIKRIVLTEPNKYEILDMCAGNALTSAIIAYLLPVTNVIAVDKKERIRKYENIRKFKYEFISINEYDKSLITENTIIVSVHPCKKLALDIIKIFLDSKAKYLFMMPCCNGKIIEDEIIKNKLGTYLTWAKQLRDIIIFNGHQATMTADNSILSPKNAIISAEKSNTMNCRKLITG